MGYDRTFLISLYRKMLLIRQFEERVKYLFLEGIMPGTIHQYHGQEAIAVGVCSALNSDDVITSTHRPHGHALAKGLTVESLMHELFGKTTGCCCGKAARCTWEIWRRGWCRRLRSWRAESRSLRALLFPSSTERSARGSLVYG